MKTIEQIIEEHNADFDEDIKRALCSAFECFGTEEEVRAKFAFNTVDSYAAADRACILANNVLSYLVDSPVIALNRDLFAKAALALRLLHELYSDIVELDVKAAENGSGKLDKE